jgi:Aspartyl protease
MEAINKAQSERRKCKVVSNVTSMKMPFTWIMRDATHIEAFAVDVRINGKATARLQIDTGAGGILIRRGIAQKAGLVPLVHTKILGIGDQDAQKGNLAADLWRILNVLKELTLAK